MKANFQTALAAVLEHEGGWSDHPTDPGGPTMKGVTLETYRSFKHNQHLTKEDLRNIPDADLQELYRRKYWDKVAGDSLPAGIDYAVFDYAVNSGPGRAAKLLQRLVGVAPDGAIGPYTIAAVEKQDPIGLLRAYNTARLAFLQGLPTFDTFGKGWSRRVASVSTQSAAMA